MVLRSQHRDVVFETPHCITFIVLRTYHAWLEYNNFHTSKTIDLRDFLYLTKGRLEPRRLRLVFLTGP